MWQHNWVHEISFLVSFIIPALIGYGYARYTGNLTPMVGALGGFLIPGVARVVMVQHATFCINSLCHMIGTRPYSTSHTGRDSWIAAIFTMGEGYHNYHHEFQWDYRNGVKPWQLDPSKWFIWTLSKMGMARSQTRSSRKNPTRRDQGDQASSNRQNFAYPRSRKIRRRSVRPSLGKPRRTQRSLDRDLQRITIRRPKKDRFVQGQTQ